MPLLPSRHWLVVGQNRGLPAAGSVKSIQPSSACRESPIKHCYWPFYRNGMAEMIPDLIQNINSLSRLKFDDGERNFLPKEKIRDKCSGSQQYPFQGRQVMIKALFLILRATIDALVTKFYHVLIDSHLFLACGLCNISTHGLCNISTPLFPCGQWNSTACLLRMIISKHSAAKLSWTWVPCLSAPLT